MIEFQCPHCEHRIKAQINAAGIRSKCPRCKANLTVPMPDQVEPLRHDLLLEPEDFLEEEPVNKRIIDSRIKDAAKTGVEKVGRIAKLTLIIGGGGFAFLILVAVLMNLANPDAALKSRSERLEKEIEELRGRNKELEQKVALTPKVASGAPVQDEKKQAVTRKRKSPRTGDITMISGGSGYLAVDSKSHSRMMKLAIAKDDIGLSQMVLQGKIIATPIGTKVRMIDPGFLTCGVRIIDGPHSGKYCIVPVEFVSGVFN
ncbi:zinc ribbon domain-containing protein [Gimesia fumaroli]|uniref:Uncharacterized protein n=1 Tax=Gimesia fumaroli TaxID=2527976 RepID=A0A518I8S7_9PLAN|nr:hypothetical protein [Gimesia fumaroli]QDV49518.1 hypothetical protein Enr17x_15370 [Gimesia fumaroli]